MPLDRAGKPRRSVYRFKPLSEKERREFSQREKEVRTYRKERQRRATQQQNMPKKKTSRKPALNKEKFSRSPIMDRSNKKANRKKAPPVRYKAPKPNPDVEPLQRKDNLSRSWNKSQKSEGRAQKSEVRIRKFRNKGGRSESHMQKSDGRQQRWNAGRLRLNER
jgi:hypothetical protein